MPETTDDNAGVIAPPPALYLGGLAAGLLAQRLRPWRPLAPAAAAPIGNTLVVGGVALLTAGIRELRAAGTGVDPRDPTTVLVRTGIYRYTRNPLYLGLSCVYAGVTARVNSGWPLLLLPAVLAVIRRGVIDREELYLERSFGDDYRSYRAQVRRWL